MAVNEPIRIAGPFIGDGVLDELDFDFETLAVGDVSVGITNADDVEVLLALNMDYTVALSSGSAGGTITLLTPLATGLTAHVYGDAMPYVRTGNIISNPGGFFPAIVNAALDRVHVGLLQLAAKMSRAIQLPRNPLAVSGKYPVILPDGSVGWSFGTGADGALRADLAETTGAALSKTSRGNSVERELTWARAAGPASINEFYDATNGVAAARMALEAAIATGAAVAWRGDLVMDQPVTLTAGTMLIGEGATSNMYARGRTCLVRGFTGTEPLLSLLDDVTIRHIDIDGDNQGTGDNIQIFGSRVLLDTVSTRNAGRHGCWLGDLDNDALNANCWSFSNMRAYRNAGCGLLIHHTNSDTGVNFPQGAPNVNAGSIFGGDFLLNGGDGLKIGNAIDNKFYGMTVQASAGRNYFLDAGAQGNLFFGPYSEAGGNIDKFAAGSRLNAWLFNQVPTLSLALVDEGEGNTIWGSHAGMLPDQFALFKSIALLHSGAGNFPSLDLYAGENVILAAQLQGKETGVGSQGKGVATAKRNGNTPIDIFEWSDGVGINVLSGGLRVAGTAVVGARQAAIADAAGGTEIATTNAILAALRAHGLIA